MVLDQTGALANVKRHDYLPFGEELFTPTSSRTAVEGYTSGDGVRQHFTQKERDVETGLDYFGARYYGSSQGRFTGADPFNIVLEVQEERDPRKGQDKLQNYLSEPQQWNRYSYTLNNPLRYVDPTGEAIKLSDDPEERERQMQALREAVGADAAKYLYVNQGKNADGSANYFVGIRDPVDGGRSFEQINAVAGELGGAIRNPEVARLEFVPLGTIVQDDAGARARIGPSGRYSVGTSPAVTGVFKGVITIKMLDWGKHPDLGYLPGELMTDGKDNTLTPSVMEAHELGHAFARMIGYKDGRDRKTVEDAGVDVENKVRNLQNPGGPTRKSHNVPPPR